MIDDLKISFVALVDNKNQYREGLTERNWEHEKFVRDLLKKEVCLMGRKTHEITNWKGSKSWVLTTDRKWTRSGVGTIHSIDDLHLFVDEGTEIVYVLGGMSLYQTLSEYVDEIHLFVFNNKKGEEDWIDLDMRNWKPLDYSSNKIWSYAKLERK
jgi:dihydrofolate reductase